SRAGNAQPGRLPLGVALPGRGDDVDLARLPRALRDRALPGLTRLTRLADRRPVARGQRHVALLAGLGQPAPALLPVADVTAAGVDIGDEHRQGRQPEPARRRGQRPHRVVGLLRHLRVVESALRAQHAKVAGERGDVVGLDGGDRPLRARRRVGERAVPLPDHRAADAGEPARVAHAGTAGPRIRLSWIGLAWIGLAWIGLTWIGLTGVRLLAGVGPALRPGCLPGARVPDSLAKLALIVLPRSELPLAELTSRTVLALAELLLTGNPAGARLRPGRLPGARVPDALRAAWPRRPALSLVRLCGLPRSGVPRVGAESWARLPVG